MIALHVQHGIPSAIKADALAYFLCEDGPLFRRQVREIGRWMENLPTPLASGAFSGKEGQTLLLFPRGFASTQLLLIGIGKRERLTRERLRRASSAAVKQAELLHAASLALCEPDPEILSGLPVSKGEDVHSVCAASFAEGAFLTTYRFDKYISRSEERKALKSAIIVTGSVGRANHVADAVERARLVCEATCLARNLENAPASEVYPVSLARRAVEAGRKAGFKVTVFDERKIKTLGMGGLLGVAQGSAQPPRFLVLDYAPRAAHRGTVVLVGKGVTFDSGGISIKPSAGMAEMKMDMSGAAAVIGALQAAAGLRLPLRVVGLIPATENLPGGRAMKPGDILRHYNGLTSEVDNTDAEGRLILADALGYAVKFKPDLVIDLATLTGACVVALGHVATGMMGNDPVQMQRLKEAGERTYERVWELPMFEEYEKLVKSDVADVKNVGGRWAGAITAAFFLKKFIGPYRWIHLDIAGTSIMEEPFEYIPKGGSGVGVRLLADFLSRWKKT